MQHTDDASRSCCDPKDVAIKAEFLSSAVAMNVRAAERTYRTNDHDSELSEQSCIHRVRRVSVIGITWRIIGRHPDESGRRECLARVVAYDWRGNVHIQGQCTRDLVEMR